MCSRQVNKDRYMGHYCYRHQHLPFSSLFRLRLVFCSFFLEIIPLDLLFNDIISSLSLPTRYTCVVRVCWVVVASVLIRGRIRLSLFLFTMCLFVRSFVRSRMKPAGRFSSDLLTFTRSLTSLSHPLITILNNKEKDVKRYRYAKHQYEYSSKWEWMETTLRNRWEAFWLL